MSKLWKGMLIGTWFSLNSSCQWQVAGSFFCRPSSNRNEGVAVIMKGLTCSFLAGVLCPAAAGNCSGWFWGEVGSAAAAFPFSLFSCGCLASESAPDSVVMVNHAGVEEGKEGNQMSQLTCYELIYCRFSALCNDKFPRWCRHRDVDIVWQQNKKWS